jgi:signal transduction histidine kinase
MLPQKRVHRAAIVASVLVPVSLFLVAALLNKADVMREAQTSARHMAIVMDEHARKVFDSVNLVTSYVDDHVSRLAHEDIMRPETSAFLAVMMDALEQAVSIWVADENGEVLAGSQPWNRTQNIFERDFFQTHVNEGAGNYVSSYFVGRATTTPSFAISRRRSSRDGNFVGTIHVALSPAYFSRFYGEAAPGPHFAAALVRSDGAVLARYPADLQETLTAQGTLNRSGPLAASGDLIARSGNGEERILAYRRVGAYPVYVVFGSSVSGVLREWIHNVVAFGAVSAFAALLLLGVTVRALRHAQAERVALERLQSETRQRTAAENDLRQAQKMEGIGQLTGGVAHDFNNLLAVVLGNLRLLGKQVVLTQSAQRLLDGAIQGAERGAFLTQRLLAFARRQDLNPQSLDVGKLLDEMSALMRQSVGTEITIAFDIQPNLSAVLADANQLELAMLNLIVNARDAMPDGGSITVSAREDFHADGESGERMHVCISVADTGPGMDEETLSRAVEPFFTTKGVGKGTGMGLAMVHGFAAQSGGSFRLESPKDQGVVASICLPMSDESPIQFPLSASDEAALPSRPLNLLLVDDDALVMMGTTAMLEDLGHQVTECSSAFLALEALGKESSFDLVITDQSMPGMTGVELARRIHATLPAMPVLIASGHAELPPHEARRLPLLTKPFTQEQLERALQDALAQA